MKKKLTKDQLWFKQHSRKYKNLYTGWEGKKRKCRICHKFFVPKVYNQKMCSPKCREISQNPEFLLNNGKYNNWLKLRFEILKRDNFTCRYCGRNVNDDGIKLCVDHVKPRNRGGKDNPDNLVTSCSECNAGKSDVLLENRTLKSVNTLTKQ